MALTLTWRDATECSVDVDGSILRADTLAGLDPRAVESMTLRMGNAVVPLGVLFRVETKEDAPDLVRIEGDLRALTSVGRGMMAGRLEVRGRVGPHAGSSMTGGRIEIWGDAADCLGAEMRGGLIHVHGDAGDRVGAAYSGSRLGMREGVILVDGRAGDFVGQGMRRGLIAVKGAMGAAAGNGMIAGSIFAFGAVGTALGAGMKRGTLFLGAGDPSVAERLSPTFLASGSHSPPFLTIYERQLEAWGFGVPRHRPTQIARYNGDTSVRGRGEILIATP